MKTENEDKIIETLLGYTERASEFTGSIVEWVQQQAPDLANEIVVYGRASSTISVALGIFLFFFVVVLFSILVYKKACGDSFGAASLISIFPIMGGGFLIAHNLRECIQSWFAPKLYLLNYLKDFI